MIKKIGILGAAYASTISYTFYCISYIYLLKKNEGFLLRNIILNKEDVIILKNTICQFINGIKGHILNYKVNK